VSIVTAPGPGQRITIFSRCHACHVHVVILPKKEAYIDRFGRHLHLLYEIATGTDAFSLKQRELSVGVDKTPSMIAVEFNGGSHRLNYGGSLSLVGGNGTYDVRIYEGEAGKRVPHWHYLSAMTVGTAYSIPDHHSVLGALVGTPAIIDRLPVNLDHTPIPVAGVVEFTERSNHIFTGWWG
jgi:hypothetical protein